MMLGSNPGLVVDPVPEPEPDSWDPYVNGSVGLDKYFSFLALPTIILSTAL
jgi:hypothetical protein